MFQYLNYFITFIGAIWLFIKFCKFVNWLSIQTKDPNKPFIQEGEYFLDNKSIALFQDGKGKREVTEGPKFINMDHNKIRIFNKNNIYVSLSSYKYKCKDKNRLSIDTRFNLYFDDIEGIWERDIYNYSQSIKEKIQSDVCEQFQDIFARYTKEEIIDNKQNIKNDLIDLANPIIFAKTGYKIESIAIFEMR